MLSAVSDRAGPDPLPSLPLVWRIPPWQPAGLILLAAVLLALVLYGHFSAGPLLFMAVVAVAALVSAFYAARLLFVADDDGLWIRRAFSPQQLIEWRDVSTIEMEHVRGTTVTVRITRRNGSFADVPPSLLLPSLPTGVKKVRSRVHTVAMQLNAVAASRDH
jgi:hypothetical protein